MMKRNLLKLLFAAITAFGMCGSASAQLAEGEYYIRNVSAKQYMAGANSWGTQLSLKNNGDLMKLKALEDGSYSIKNAMLLNGNGGSADPYYVGMVANDASSYNLFTDQTETPYQFKELTDEEKAAINDQGTAVNLSASKKYYYIVYVDQDNIEEALQPGDIGVTSHASVIGTGLDCENADQVWEVLTREELIADLKANASEDNPMWATSLINDPDFSRFMSNMSANKSWWTIDAGNRNIAGDASNFCAESWRSTFNYYQTLTDLPNGTYRLKAQASVCDYDSEGKDYPYLYATTNGITKQASFFVSSKTNGMEEGESSMNQMSASFLADKYWTDVIEFSVYDNTLTLGFKGTRNNTWSIFDNVQLEYLGFDASQLQIVLDQARDNANELLKSKMYKEVRKALAAARDENPASETEEGYLDIIKKINKVIGEAETSIAEYEKMAAKIAEVTPKVAVLDAAGQKYFNETAKIQSKYDAEELESVDEVTLAYSGSILAQTTPGADFTEAIINPGFEDGTYNGWTTTTSNDTGAKPTNNDTYKMEGSVGNYLFNTWSVGQPITQTVTGIRNGKYRLTAVIASNENTNLQLKMNDMIGTAVGRGGGTAVPVSVEGNVTTGSIIISAGTDNTTWYKVDDFHLIYIGEVELNDFYNIIKDLTATISSIRNSKMNASVRATLYTAYATGLDVSNNPNKYKDLEKLNQVIEQLNSAINDANSSIAVYDTIKDYFTKVDNGLDAEGQKVFYENADKIKKAYEDETITDGVSELEGAKEAFIPAVKAQTTEPSTLTEAVLNFSCDNGIKPDDMGWSHARVAPIGWHMYDANNDYTLIDNIGCFHVNYWSTEGDTDGSGMTRTFTELWNWKSGSENFSNNIIVAHDKETGYRSGTYHIEVRARMRDLLSGTQPEGMHFYANNVNDKTQYNHETKNGDAWYNWYTVDFVVGEDGVIDFGFKLKDINFSWLSFKQIELTYVSANYSQQQIDDILADVPTGKMAAAEQSALDAALKAFKEKPTIPNGQVLNIACSDARTSIALYSAIAADIDTYTDKAGDNLDRVGIAYYNQKIKAVKNAYDAGTLTENNVKDVYLDAVKQQGEGADMTEVIVNNDFEAGSLAGWTTKYGQDTGAKEESNGTYTMAYEGSTDVFGKYVFNTWPTGYPIYQTITGLQNGNYRLSALLASDGGNGLFLIANDTHSQAFFATDKGKAVLAELTFLVTDGTATIGAVGGSSDQYVAAGVSWYKADNFQLKFEGADNVQSYLNQIAEIITANESTLDKAFNKDVKKQLSDAIEAGRAANETNTIPEAQAIIEAINTALEKAEGSIKVYDPILEYYNKAMALDSYGQAEYLKEAADVIKAFNNGDIVTGTKELEAAEEAYIIAVKAQQEEGSDMTGAIVNPSFEGAKLKWSSEKGYSHFSAMVNRNNAYPGTVGNKYAYVINPGQNAAVKPVDLYQQIDGLRAGIYSITLNTNTNSSGIRLYANNEFTEIDPSSSDCELYVMLFEDNEPLQIHVRGELSGTQYVYVDNFQMKYEGEEVDVDTIHAPMQQIVYDEQDRCYKAYQNTGQLVELKELVKAVRAAKASAAAYAKAVVYIDSAKNYMLYSNVYSPAAYKKVSGMIKNLRALYNSRQMTTVQALSIMKEWLHADDKGNMFDGFYANRANAEAYPDYPVLYYMNDAWSLDKTNGEHIAVNDEFKSNTWSTEAGTFAGAKAGTSAMAPPFMEYWQPKTRTGLEPGKIHAKAIGLGDPDASNDKLPQGLYKVSAFIRVAHEGMTDDLHGVTFHAQTAANASDTIDIAAVGKRYNDTGVQNNAGFFVLDSLIVRDKDGNSIDINIDIADDNNVNWVSYKFVHVEKVRDLYWYEIDKPASDDQIAEFDELLKYASTREIGFAEEEYATYANIQVRKDYKEAAAFRETGNLIEETVLAYINALQKTNWIPNLPGDTNAIYNPHFAILEIPGRTSSAITAWNIHDASKPNAKTGPTGAASIMVDTRFKLFYNQEYGTNEFSSAARFRFTETRNYSSPKSEYVYGEAEGYEMPLKGRVRDDDNNLVEATYRFSGTFGLYAAKEDKSANHNFIIEVLDPDDIVVARETYKAQVAALDTTQTKLQSFNVFFSNTKAGNYKLKFRNANVDDEFDFLVSNLQLYREPNVPMTVTAARYGTFIAPFDVKLPEGAMAYTVVGVEKTSHTLEGDNSENPKQYTSLILDDTVTKTTAGGTVTITPMNSARRIPAHTAVVIYSPTPFTKYCGGIKSEATPEEMKYGYLTGTYEPITAPEGSYVLQRRAYNEVACFYQVNYAEGGRPQVGKYRCYLNLPSTSNARLKMLTFEDLEEMLDNATIIKSAETEETVLEVAGIYSVSGAPQQTLKKGINIVKYTNGTTKRIYIK